MDSNDVRDVWEERTGEYSPAYYAYYGPDATSAAIRRLLERFVGRDAAVLELGCSSGRHLAHLCAAGFDDLAGIDVNADAFDVMAEHYPELADAGTFYCDPIEDVVRGFDDDQFDAVYSVETLQHLHHDAAWVYDELARITADLLVTVESEHALSATVPNAEPERLDDASVRDETPKAAGSDDSPKATVPDGTPEAAGSAHDVTYVNGDLPLYHRDWHAIFTERGFVEIEVDDATTDAGAPGDEGTGGDGVGDASALSRDTIRAFRRR